MIGSITLERDGWKRDALVSLVFLVIFSGTLVILNIATMEDITENATQLEQGFTLSQTNSTTPTTPPIIYGDDLIPWPTYLHRTFMFVPIAIAAIVILNIRISTNRQLSARSILLALLRVLIYTGSWFLLFLGISYGTYQGGSGAYITMVRDLSYIVSFVINLVIVYYFEDRPKD